MPVPVVLCLGIYIVGGIGGIFTRLPWIDERFVAEPAIHLLHGAPMVVTFYEPADPTHAPFDRHTYWMPPVWFLLETVWFAVLGSKLVALRFLTWCFAGLNLAGVYILARELCGKRSAAWAVFLTSANFLFMAHAVDGRMDMMVSAMSTLGIASYLVWWKSRPMTAWFVSHSLIVLGGLANPIGIVGWCGLVGIQIMTEGRRLQWRCLAFATIPYLVGALAWGIYIAEDWPAFQAQFFGKVSRPALLTGIKEEITDRYLHLFGVVFDNGIRIGSKVALTVFLWMMMPLAYLSWRRLIRRDRIAGRLMALWLIYFLAMGIFIPLKVDYNIVEILPLYGILAGYAYGGDEARLAFLTTRTVGIVGALASLYLLVAAISANPFKNEFKPAVAILSAASPRERICGPPEFRWYQEPESTEIKTDVVVDRFYGYYSKKVPDWVVLRPNDKPEKAVSSDEGYQPYITDLFQTRLKLVYSNPSFRIFRKK